MTEPQEIVFVARTDSHGIFVSVEAYVVNSGTQSALVRATTWGEFRELLPEGEFEELRLWEVNDMVSLDVSTGLAALRQPVFLHLVEQRLVADL